MEAILSPHFATFRARFLLVLQYRAAALAGFGTQMWFGLIRILILAAFFKASTHAQPIGLPQTIDYIWLGQAFLALLPWAVDPEVSAAMRSGNITYDRLRPVDTYFYWFARTAGWMVSRAVPRAGLMFAFAAIALPLVGLGAWGLRPPASIEAGALFILSMILVVPLGAAIANLMNIAMVATMNERGVNILISPVVVLFSGNIIPLPLMPQAWRMGMLLQPFAGCIDIPSRLYFGQLTGNMALLGLGAQAFWTIVLALIGRAAMEAVMGRLQAQGG